MEYLVNTSGKVSKFHSKAYVVKANSEQEAQEIAKQNFKKEFDCIKINTKTQSCTRTKRAIVACILMVTAIIISLFDYPYVDKFLFFFSKTENFSMAPQMTSCILAIIFYAIYIIRFKGIERTVGSRIDIAFTVISVLLLSSVFQLILGAETLKLLWIIPLPSSYIVLVITIIASLLGVKLVSAGCMAFIAITAVSNLSVASVAMGFWGVVYVMCAFVGILLYLSVEPAVLESFSQIKESFSKTFNKVKNDFEEAKDEAKTIVDKVSE